MLKLAGARLAQDWQNQFGHPVLLAETFVDPQRFAGTEEAAVAAHLPTMDRSGILVIADAAHTTKANCRHLTQEQGADYLFFLKGNQPHAHAKAQQLLAGDFPPSGPVPR